MIKVSPTAKISALADIEESIKGSKIVIMENVRIDSFVKIKPSGGMGDLIIGSDSAINSGCVIYTGNGITIGKSVAIAANCTLAPTNHEYQNKDIPIRLQGFKKSKGGIIIEDDVWIGANCVILDGTYIEKGCVIGAGSLIKGRLESFGVYVGNPIKKIGNRN